MAAQWHYERNGETLGPISAAELKQLADSGQLQPTDRVWKDGLADWVAASHLKGLFSTTAADLPAVAPRPVESAVPDSLGVAKSPDQDVQTTPSVAQQSATVANQPTEPGSSLKSLNNGLVLGLVVAGVAHFWGLSFLGIYLFGFSRLLLLVAIVAAGYFGLLHRWGHYGRKLFKELQASSARADGTPAKPDAVDSLKSLKVAAESLRAAESVRLSAPTSSPSAPKTLPSDAAQSPLVVLEELKSERDAAMPTPRATNRKPIAIAAACVIGLLGMSGVWKFGLGGRPVTPSSTLAGKPSRGLEANIQNLVDLRVAEEVADAMSQHDKKRSEADPVFGKSITSKKDESRERDSSQPSRTTKQPTISLVSRERRREDSSGTSTASTETASSTSQVTNTKELDITINSKREELLQLRNELNHMLQE